MLIVNNVICSGQIGDVPEIDKLVEGGIRAETIQAMENIQTMLTAVGSSMDKIFKCLYVVDISNSA